MVLGECTRKNFWARTRISEFHYDVTLGEEKSMMNEELKRILLNVGLTKVLFCYIDWSINFYFLSKRYKKIRGLSTVIGDYALRL